ncbi:5847_t:CDS:10 [Diversispora eburnea]|uniref:5847_t:CDS:1 n=1 Tax=Diversispora eburnea TaxID=1213867 RepID=A0A9N9GA84_9GLOM|nr:5847_t:CDS:10 [Diversispora eburnea]
MSRSPSQEDAPLLTDNRIPNDREDEESLLAPRDHSGCLPLRHGKFTRLEVLLAFTCLILLVLMSIFAGLYSGKTNKHHEILPPDEPFKNVTNVIYISLLPQLISDMDLNVDPCDDFFQYSCGGWIKSHIIPDEKGRFGYFDTLYENNQIILKEILEGEFVPSDEQDLPPPEEIIDKQNFYKLQDFYESCMNETRINKLGRKPLLSILTKIIEDFPVDQDYSYFGFNPIKREEKRQKIERDQDNNSPQLDSYNLTNALSHLSTIGVTPLFLFYTNADAKNPEINALHLQQSGLGLPSKEYYNEENILDIYQGVIAELFEKANIAYTVVEFEKELAKISLSADESSDPEATYNNQTLVSLSRLSPTFIWSHYISSHLPPTSKDPTKIILHSNEYFKNLSILVNQTPTPVLQAYLIWQAILGYSEFLDESFRAPLRRLMSKLRGIDESVKPKRWQVCLRAVDSALGHMAGRFFVLRAFGQSKEIADQMIEGIKTAFINRMPEIDWLDPQTREKAIHKVKKIIQKIGYPTKSPNIMSPKSIAEYYERITINRDEFFENIKNVEIWQSERIWRNVDKPVDHGKWYMEPQTNPTSNEIVFPAGILQSPFFSSNAPEYINFGAIGMVIGHELTYDASGRLTQWWSNETVKAFNNKSECFIHQYSNFTVNDPNGNPTNLNGHLTLGENLADNGGGAFQAWFTRFSNDSDSKLYNNELLPGLNVTREQLFYISFGHSWCSKTRPETAVRTDPHSPPVWRVNGVLRNSKHFAETFNCKVGTKMNPIEKCDLW